jgi:hypothetical protein
MVETEESIVPLRSWKNRMDPCWNFPHQELRTLFQHATLNESMFLALEHMQVDYVTVRTSRLDKFWKNVISFPQDMWSFAQREGMLQHYKVEDRVNSVRGPGSDPDRVPMLARDAAAAITSRCLLMDEPRAAVALDILLLVRVTTAVNCPCCEHELL